MKALQESGSAKPVVMTSIELVDFINSQRNDSETPLLRHDHFMAKVPKVLGADAAPKFMGTAPYANGTGGKVVRSIYTFPKREACLMAMSYSYELQAKVFDRMTELEERSKPDPLQMLNDPVAMRGLLLSYTDQVLALKSKVENLEPKAIALDRIATAEGSMCISNAAKLLQVKQTEVFRWLSENRWIFKRHGGASWLGYQDKIRQGLLEMKVVTLKGDDDARGKIVESVLVTPKGLAKLSQALSAKQSEADYRNIGHREYGEAQRQMRFT